MKHVKVLAFAAIAAAILMSFVGAGSASASVLCSTTVSPCPSAQKWANTTIDFSSENSTGPGAGASILEDTFGFVQNECSSTLKGTLTNGSNTVAASLSGITFEWSTCTRSTKTVRVGTLDFHNIAGTSNGTVTASGFEITSIAIDPVTLEELSCIFETGNGHDLGTLTEGIPATIDVNTTVTPIAGSDPRCPSSVRWTAKYKVTSPSNTTGSLSTS